MKRFVFFLFKNKLKNISEDELLNINGSGKNGRITKNDILMHIKSSNNFEQDKNFETKSFLEKYCLSFMSIRLTFIPSLDNFFITKDPTSPEPKQCMVTILSYFGCS